MNYGLVTIIFSNFVNNRHANDTVLFVNSIKVLQEIINKVSVSDQEIK